MRLVDLPRVAAWKRGPLRAAAGSDTAAIVVSITANQLTVNSSKTEFLLIGLQQQLAKITTAHSIPLIQLGILVSSSIVISLSPTKISLQVLLLSHS